MRTEAATMIDQPPLSHNLLGQRLGRKGRDTRERILAATERLLASPIDTQISLTAVAREATLGMTSLYVYFSDLTELLLAALERIMVLAEESYIAHAREYWADAELAAHCDAFVRSYYAFWQRHTRILHQRNSLADANDARMRQYRIDMTQPLIHILARQMNDEAETYNSPPHNTAAVLILSTERLVTVTTEAYFSLLPIDDIPTHVTDLLAAQSRLLEIAIRDRREMHAPSLQ